MQAQNKTEIYKAHINMIRKAAWHYAQQYKIEFLELMSEGNEIFLNALETHDPEKSKFGTHLTWQLMRIGDYCKAVHKNAARFVSHTDDLIDDREDFKSDFVTLKEHKLAASDEVTEILNIIGEWDGKGCRPSYNSVQKRLRTSDRTSRQIKSAWESAEKWWAEYEKAEKGAKVCANM